MKKTPGINARMREIEKSKTLTVIADNPGVTGCQQCKARGLTFNCHMFRESPRVIVELCKSCAIARAGGEEKVYVRSGEFLRRKWEGNKRLKCSAPRKGAGPSGADRPHSSCGEKLDPRDVPAAKTPGVAS